MAFLFLHEPRDIPWLIPEYSFLLPAQVKTSWEGLGFHVTTGAVHFLSHGYKLVYTLLLWVACNTTIVYNVIAHTIQGVDHMKNVTLSANEDVIRKAKNKAQQNNTTLNSLFRKWLDDYTRDRNIALELDRFLSETEYVEAGRGFTRDECNER